MKYIILPISDAKLIFTETTTFIKENPQVVEYLIPTVTFIAGLFTGNKSSQQNTVQQQPTEQTQPQNEPIDFDKIP